MLSKSLFAVTFMLFSIAGFSQSEKLSMDALIKNNLALAKDQYALLESTLPANRMPKSYNMQTEKLETSDTKWWCSGFYPGTLWYIHEYTKDAGTKKAAEARLAILEKEKHFKGNHDLVFMMYCSFGNAYRITGNPSYKTTIDTAAMSLATRFRPSIQSIHGKDHLHPDRKSVV
jgi:hypothetical protein